MSKMNSLKNVTKLVISFGYKLGIKSKDFIAEKRDKRKEKPTDIWVTLILFFGWPLYFFAGLTVFSWLFSVTLDSAKWALSAQVQATAAIFGLLIAAMALRWRRVTEQEQQLKNYIDAYLQELGKSDVETPHGGTVQVLDIEYENDLQLINKAREKKEKLGKQALINLGRLWVIKSLSAQYRLHLTLGRYLTAGQTKQLNEVHKLCKKSAIDTLEYYHKRPEDFLLNMHETFMFRQDNSLKRIVAAIISSNSKVIAEEVKRTRLTLRPLFYLTSFVLASAIVLGLSILTGIEGTLFPFSLEPNSLAWAVATPIGLSFVGIALCLAIIGKIL